MNDTTTKHEYNKVPSTLSLTSQPFDILDRIAFAIEDPRDILALSLTSRQLHDIRTDIWDIFCTSPGIAPRFCRLAINEAPHLEEVKLLIDEYELLIDIIPSGWITVKEKEGSDEF
ncbi:hypothetical protein M422DRAFT_247627 [Sphaerobolus stellatus SS14]|nr:hypothetical protein M422DRAFT_247627 [Sphaerobolus stellatus SS14]